MLSIVEVVDLILVSSLVSLNLDGTDYIIFNVIFQSSLMPIHAMLLWIFILCVICGFIALSYSIFHVAWKGSIEDRALAKFLLLIGLFLIIGGFIKTSFIVLLSNTNINTIVPDTFQNTINAQSLLGAILWLYFTIVVSCFLVSGLIFGGIGLKWMLLIQEEETTSK